MLLAARGQIWMLLRVQVQWLEPTLPALTHVHMCDNGLSAPQQPLHGFTSLQVSTGTLPAHDQ